MLILVSIERKFLKRCRQASLNDRKPVSNHLTFSTLANLFLIPPCGLSFLPTLVVGTLYTPLQKAEIENDNPRGEGLICFAWSVSQQSPDRYPLTIPTTINAIVICDKSKSPERTKVASLRSTTCTEAIRRLYSQSHEKALMEKSFIVKCWGKEI